MGEVTDRIDRYELLGELAAGGMATVFIGRQRGPFGFTRTVAIKSMHAHLAKDEGFRAMFLDEASLTARIRHPNVVPTLDVVASDDRVLLVMEYVEGVSLSTLFKRVVARGQRLPPPIVSAILVDALRGLHAAHQLCDDDGNPLHVVHRDVSPQNIHVGVDGSARVLDFGVAKASARRYVTQSGEVKGKLAYMSSEQCCGEEVDHRTDVYAAGVVLWEALTGQRLITGDSEGELLKKVIAAQFDKPSLYVPELAGSGIEYVAMRALSEKKESRWASAEAMANALSHALPPARPAEVAALVRDLAAEELASRSARFRTAPSEGRETQAIAEILTEHATETMKPSVTPRTPRRGPTFLLIGGGALLVVALVGGAFALGSRNARRPPVATDLAVSVPPTVSAAPTPAPTVSAAPTVSVSAAPTVSVSAAPTVAKTPRRGPSRPDCRVPYVVDANGDRHYRPECVN